VEVAVLDREGSTEPELEVGLYELGEALPASGVDEELEDIVVSA
jgi:hypothetical protein